MAMGSLPHRPHTTSTAPPGHSTATEPAAPKREQQTQCSTVNNHQEPSAQPTAGTTGLTHSPTGAPSPHTAQGPSSPRPHPTAAGLHPALTWCQHWERCNTPRRIHRCCAGLSLQHRAEHSAQDHPMDPQRPAHTAPAPTDAVQLPAGTRLQGDEAQLLDGSSIGRAAGRAGEEPRGQPQVCGAGVAVPLHAASQGFLLGPVHDPGDNRVGDGGGGP